MFARLPPTGWLQPQIIICSLDSTKEFSLEHLSVPACLNDGKCHFVVDGFVNVS